MMTDLHSSKPRRETSFGRQIEDHREVSSGRQWLLVAAFALLGAIGWLIR